MTKNITVKELFDLQVELNTVLSAKVSIGTRYAFHKLKMNVDDILKKALEEKDALIFRHGTDGQLKVYNNEETKEVNENFKNFIAEWNKVLDNQVEVEYSPIQIEMIEDIETEKPIQMLFQLIENN